MPTTGTKQPACRDGRNAHYGIIAGVCTRTSSTAAATTIEVGASVEPHRADGGDHMEAGQAASSASSAEAISGAQQIKLHAWSNNSTEGLAEGLADEELLLLVQHSGSVRVFLGGF